MQTNTQSKAGKAIIVKHILEDDEYIVIIEVTKGNTVKTAKIDFM